MESCSEDVAPRMPHEVLSRDVGTNTSSQNMVCVCTNTSLLCNEAKSKFKPTAEHVVKPPMRKKDMSFWGHVLLSAELQIFDEV